MTNTKSCKHKTTKMVDIRGHNNETQYSVICCVQPIVVITYMCIHNATGSHSLLLLLFRVNIFANECDEKSLLCPWVN